MSSRSTAVSASSDCLARRAVHSRNATSASLTASLPVRHAYHGERCGCGAVHGLPSTLRDLVLRQPSVSFEAAERALAHAVGTTVTQAYMRADLLDERRALMQDWADFVEGCE